jgi:hypothetical protein
MPDPNIIFLYISGQRFKVLTWCVLKRHIKSCCVKQKGHVSTICYGMSHTSWHIPLFFEHHGNVLKKATRKYICKENTSPGPRNMVDPQC